MWSCWKNITAPDGTLYTKKAVNHRCIIGLKKENKQTAIVLLCICWKTVIEGTGNWQSIIFTCG